MPFASSYEPVEAGGTTFHELVRGRSERIALVDGPAELTYATLASRVERVAALLASRGFGPGDVLAIKAPNMAPWVGVALAAMTAGGAVTGINPDVVALLPPLHHVMGFVITLGCGLAAATASC